MTYRLRNIGIAIALAAVAALLTIFWVTNYKRNVEEGEESVTVWVAARDIPAGTSGSRVVEGSFLKEQHVERRNVAPGALSSEQQIADLVATDAIYAGEQVTTRRFRPLEEQGLRARLTGNLRAIQVPGDANQLLAGTLKDGDRVDLLASLKYKFVAFRQGAAGRTSDEMVASRVVLRNLLVLSAASETNQEQKLTRPGEQLAVTLAVTDAQAQKLFFVMKNGDWSLELRPTTDPADSPESVETVGSVLGDGIRREQIRELVFGRRVPR
ncbi:MAG: Flp pilus assembly protein CpaB [Actinomycetota bacterium]|nr:Flp pilus assembly protein CpaB [Actinomycetota bacterium]